MEVAEKSDFEEAEIMYKTYSETSWEKGGNLKCYFLQMNCIDKIK